ncbi:MAG: hypothetical protein ABL894_09825 [Hyphomicrobium sp.]
MINVNWGIHPAINWEQFLVERGFFPGYHIVAFLSQMAWGRHFLKESRGTGKEMARLLLTKSRATY